MVKTVSRDITGLELTCFERPTDRELCFFSAAAPKVTYA